MKLDVTALVVGMLVLITGVFSLWASVGHLPPLALKVALPAALVAVGAVGLLLSRHPATNQSKDRHD